MRILANCEALIDRIVLNGAAMGGLLGAAMGGTMEAIARHKEGWNGFTGNRNKAWLRVHQVGFLEGKSASFNFDYQPEIVFDSGDGPNDFLLENPNPQNSKMLCVSKCMEYVSQRQAIENQTANWKKAVDFGYETGVRTIKVKGVLLKHFESVPRRRIDIFNINDGLRIDQLIDQGYNIAVSGKVLYNSPVGSDHMNLINRVQIFSDGTKQIQMADPYFGNIRIFSSKLFRFNGWIFR